jgi:hypothetical protein
MDLDIGADGVETINKTAGKSFDGEIHGYSAFFYGKCAGCKEKQKPEK